jgi:hypothetical protein
VEVARLALAPERLRRIAMRPRIGIAVPRPIPFVALMRFAFALRAVRAWLPAPPARLFEAAALGRRAFFVTRLLVGILRLRAAAAAIFISWVRGAQAMQSGDRRIAWSLARRRPARPTPEY